MVQPDAAGVIPPVPVSCHGVASPAALSGFAGTMRLQLTLATATGVVAVTVGEAVGVTVGVTVAVAVGVTLWCLKPKPCAERLRLPGPPISFRPRTRPTTSAIARGTAIRAARAL
jgi:hypothetical protein